MSKKAKEKLSIVVIGHVDAGKSTATGNMIFSCGGVDARTMETLKKKAAEIGRESFYAAWIMDQTASERGKGVTIDCSLKQFSTKKFDVTVIDAPGHKDFLKNMITGTSQADVAILVVSAGVGEFEAGISKGGSTRDHALLAYTLGVKQLIVAVNKMDIRGVDYSRKRYQEVVSETSKFLKKIGYAPKKVAFVPISGFLCENLVTKCDKMRWYKGPTLQGAIDALQVPKRLTGLAARVPLQDVYSIRGVGTVASGRVETGSLRPDQRLVFAPSGVTGVIRSIEMHHKPLTQAATGDTVGINVTGVSRKEIGRGMVAGVAGANAPREAFSFVAQIIVTEHPGEIRVGYTPLLDCHTAHVACRFEALLAKVDRKSGKPLPDVPTSLLKGDSALVRLVPTKPMCVEPFHEYPPLGRFAIRDMNRTVAIGVVKSVSTEKGVMAMAPSA